MLHKLKDNILVKMPKCCAVPFVLQVLPEKEKSQTI